MGGIQRTPINPGHPSDGTKRIEHACRGPQRLVMVAVTWATPQPRRNPAARHDAHEQPCRPESPVPAPAHPAPDALLQEARAASAPSPKMIQSPAEAARPAQLEASQTTT